MEISRRSALKALALPVMTGVAGVATAGCGDGAAGLNVAVPWIGWELERFQDVLRGFGTPCRLLSMGDDTGAFLSDDLTAAAQPDVALVSQPSVVSANRRRLLEVPWSADATPSWRQWLPGAGGQQYGVWFKASYQSMVWHRVDPEIPDAWDWDAWVGRCHALASRGRPPLSVGAASGWVLALWFANALMSVSPATYRTLASDYSGGGKEWASADVQAALRRLADLWGHPGVFPGGGERALVTQFDQSVLDVFGSQEADMVAGPDFFWPVITQVTSFPASAVRWFPFPARRGEKQPSVVAGDAAVAFADKGRPLVEWLGTKEAARKWARAGGFLSVNEQVRADWYPYPEAMRPGALISGVRSPAAQYDIGDQLSGPLSGDDSEGSWKILTDFFTAVAVRRPSAPNAAARAVSDAISAAMNAFTHGTGGA